VLLSFAQFEREVTGERIRDKIAASKQKGMWMGGRVPLGYDVKERKLVGNPDEAKVVHRLFHLYLELGCVSKMKERVDREAIKSKVRTNASGSQSGGASYSRGALYGILQNRIYIGDIQHREKVYRGEHTGIVPRELWDRVQFQLRSDNQGRRNGLKANSSSALAGLLQDCQGNRFMPSFTVKNGRRYRYYFCSTKAGRGGALAQMRPARVPANDIEQQVSLRLQAFLQSANEVVDSLTQPEDPPARTQQIIAAARKQFARLGSGTPSSVQNFLRRVVQRIVVHPDRVEVEVDRSELRAAIAGETRTCSTQDPSNIVRLVVKARIKRRGGETRLVVPPHLTGEVPVHPVSSLLKVVARAHQWSEWIIAGKVWGGRSIAEKIGLDERYVSQILECAFLAPDIVEAILDGRQPSNLTWKKLTRRVPVDWSEQRKKFGFPNVSSR
jgi:site-specific DNA recombinase